MNRSISVSHTPDGGKESCDVSLEGVFGSQEILQHQMLLVLQSESLCVFVPGKNMCLLSLFIKLCKLAGFGHSVLRPKQAHRFAPFPEACNSFILSDAMFLYKI